MRILVRVSRLAKWSRRLALAAVPLLALSILMHRAGQLPTDSFHALGAIALVMAVLAVILGVSALFQLWHTGDAGWGRALAGLAVGGLCLLPVAYAGYLVSRYPMVLDVATDAALAPAAAFADRPGPASPVDPEIAAAFPDVVSRTYPLPPAVIHEAVEAAVLGNDWTITARQAPSAEAAGRIEAIATTFIGWRDALVFQVTPAPDGARVDMRSTTLTNGRHDLGANGRRISQFLVALDETAATLAAPAPQETIDPAIDGEAVADPSAEEAIP